MTDHDPHPTETDTRLRALLRTTDPARDLPPADPATVRRHAARIAAAREPDRVRAPAPHRRRGFALGGGLAAAAAAVVATVTLGTGGAAATALTVPAAPADPLSAMCAALTPEGLRQNATAFEARVTGIEGDRVELDVVQRFRGEVADRVTVPQSSPETTGDFSPGTFAVGGSYLLSTSDGTQVSVCGQSGPDSPELRALYEQAFGG